MIVVGGFNTSVDRLLDVDRLSVGTLIRARRSSAQPGGKGLHVALAAAILGEDVALVGIADSLHHAWLLGHLQERRVVPHLVTVSGRIRTCLAIRDSEGAITEILEGGPALSPDEKETLLDSFETLARGAVGVLSGSLPPGLEDTTYRDLIRAVQRAGGSGLLDSSGRALDLGIDARPFLVKVNEREAAELSGGNDAAGFVRTLVGRGASVAVVTQGRKGAVASWRGKLCRLEAPPGPAPNPVGSGDAFLGGLAVGLARGLDPEDVLRLGVACGSANARNAETGVFARAEAEALARQVGVRWEEGAPS